MKAVLLVVSLIAGLIPAFIVGYRWDSGRNRGHTWGYYGDFNRASNALMAIPRVKNSWINPDITLEEFGFDVVTQTGQPVRISFGERDPLRKLSVAQLTEALAAEIKQKTLTSTNR